MSSRPGGCHPFRGHRPRRRVRRPRCHGCVAGAAPADLAIMDASQVQCPPFSPSSRRPHRHPHRRGRLPGRRPPCALVGVAVPTIFLLMVGEGMEIYDPDAIFFLEI